MKRPAPSGLTLSLADGARWLIRAGNVPAEEIVSALGAAMCLQPGSTGRGLLAIVREEGGMAPINLEGPGPAFCVLPPLTDDDMPTVCMSRLAQAIARETLARGGLLVHAALAEAPLPHTVTASRVAPTAGLPAQAQRSAQPDARITAGILLAGPGTVGKSTASRRLPPPWRALSDDTTLAVCDPQGNYWAHPWPTWSRFFGYDGAAPPGGSWDVQQAVPLRAIFFLSQSPDDRVETLSVTQAAAMLMEAVQHVSGPMARHLSRVKVQTLHRQQLAAAEALARTVPAHALHLSLTGAFWEEAERMLADTPSPQPSPPGGEGAARPLGKGVAPLSLAWRGAGGEGGNAPTQSPPNDTILHVVYTGPSMNPTLTDPELLEVLPYHGRPVRPGDVVYFQPPEEQKKLVHRVVAVTPPGATPGSIRTRGDNNPSADPYLLEPADVIGQVVAAQRGSRQRQIAGGLPGVLVGTAVRLWRTINRGISRLMHGTYRALTRTGLFCSLLPAGLRPRVFVFQSRQRFFLKLMMAGRVVGQYDTRARQWRIRRPCRLFVNEATLPHPESSQSMLPHETPELGQAN